MKPVSLLLVHLLTMSLTFAQKGLPANTSPSFKEVNKKILSLFNKYPVVAVGEGFHNSALSAEWLNGFVHDDQFHERVRNIVVEFGASGYQAVMDDFVNGKEVPDTLFRRCWRETTQLFVWDNPIYEAFFREIRKKNSILPKEKRIRVLLGDPTFGSRESRDGHAFNIIEKEVFHRQETALLLYGDLHFVRKDVWFNYAEGHELDINDRNLVQLIELKYPGKVFSIWGSVNTNDPAINRVIRAEKIQIPAFLATSATELGKVDFTTFYPWADSRTDATGNMVDPSKYIDLPIMEVVDGILFRGDWEEQVGRIAPRPDEIYSDTVYVNELIRRAKSANEWNRVPRFEYFKFRWSAMYAPFLRILETVSPTLIDSEFRLVKGRYADFQWMQVMNILGYELLKKKDIQKAIAAFELATREFPDKSNTYDSLGDGYLAAGDKIKAISSYKKSIELDPGNKASQLKLNDLMKDGLD